MAGRPFPRACNRRAPTFQLHQTTTHDPIPAGATYDVHGARGPAGSRLDVGGTVRATAAGSRRRRPTPGRAPACVWWPCGRDDTLRLPCLPARRGRRRRAPRVDGRHRHATPTSICTVQDPRGRSGSPPAAKEPTVSPTVHIPFDSLGLWVHTTSVCFRAPASSSPTNLPCHVVPGKSLENTASLPCVHGGVSYLDFSMEWNGMIQHASRIKLSARKEMRTSGGGVGVGS